MKVLLTGANGYMGTRLLVALAAAGHEVVCLVRDRRRFEAGDDLPVTVVEADLLDADSLAAIPPDVEAAYYLVHSMGSGSSSFHELERRAAQNFAEAIAKTACRQTVYLSGISNDEQLSRHLASRRAVEEILASTGVPVTVLRAAIIIGAGSASFEIIRDLVEKLPVMIAPKWLRTRCQPIAIRNVIAYLTGVLGNEATFGETFDIGGPDVLTYQQMLLDFAAVRGLKRLVIPVPLLSPRLSSYWLYFVTSTNYALARSLVDSMKNEVVCAEHRIREIIPLDLIPYKDAVSRAFTLVEQGLVPSSWFDSLSSGKMKPRFLDRVQVPQHGVLSDARRVRFSRDPREVQRNIWRVGGKNGWYKLDWAWRLRGWMDRMVGGTGLRRGRRHPTQLRTGDALDFWRVLLADKAKRRLILYAEMKLPGEAWLEWEIVEDAHGPGEHELRQTATFRPSGVLGRIYWYAVSPLHLLVFGGMARAMVERRPEPPPEPAPAR